MTDFARPDQTSPLDGQPSLLDGQHSTAVAETAGNRQPVVDQHRYTGPELSALLNQVRLELGAEANIVEANRVRSGGVAGFFAKESYEVVVAAPAGAATTRRAVPTPADAATTRRAAPAPTTRQHQHDGHATKHPTGHRVHPPRSRLHCWNGPKLSAR